MYHICQDKRICKDGWMGTCNKLVKMQISILSFWISVFGGWGGEPWCVSDWSPHTKTGHSYPIQYLTYILGSLSHLYWSLLYISFSIHTYTGLSLTHIPLRCALPCLNNRDSTTSSQWSCLCPYSTHPHHNARGKRNPAGASWLVLCLRPGSPRVSRPRVRSCQFRQVH